MRRFKKTKRWLAMLMVLTVLAQQSSLGTLAAETEPGTETAGFRTEPNAPDGTTAPETPAAPKSAEATGTEPDRTETDQAIQTEHTLQTDAAEPETGLTEQPETEETEPGTEPEPQISSEGVTETAAFTEETSEITDTQEEPKIAVLSAKRRIALNGEIVLGEDGAGTVDVTAKVGGETFDPSQSYPRDSTFTFQLDFEFNNTETKPTPENPEVHYHIPDELKITADTSGTIYDKSGEPIGTYEIQGNELVLKYDPDWLEKHDSDITGYFTFTAQINDTASDNKTEVELHFPGGGGDFTVKLEDGTVTGNKSHLLNKDGTMDVTVTFTVTGNDTNVTFTDTLGDNLEFVTGEGAVFTLDKADLTPEQIEALTSGGQVDLGKLTVGTHTITYKIKPQNLNDLTDTNNQIGWTWGEEPGNSDTYTDQIQYQKEKVEKSGEQEGGKIKWTIKITPGQFQSVLGKTITDTLGEGQHYTGNIVIKKDYYPDVVTQSMEEFLKEHGNPDGKGFSYTFPAEGYPESPEASAEDCVEKFFEITYYTEPDNPEENGTFTNTAKKTPDGPQDSTSVTYDASKNVGPDLVTKDGASNGKLGGEKTVQWTLKVDPKELEDVTDVTLTDAINNPEELGTVFKPDSLKVAYEGGGELSSSEYSITWTPDEDNPTGFTLQLKGTLTRKVSITVESVSETAGTVTNAVDSSYQIDGSEKTEHDEKPVEVKSTDASIDKEGSLNAKTATWTVTVNKQDWGNKNVDDLGTGAFTVQDVLPEGMEYVEGSASYVLYITPLEHEWDPPLEQPPQLITPAYDAGTRTLSFSFTDIGKNFFILTYKTRIADVKEGETTYTNSATLQKDGTPMGNAQGSVTYKDSVLTKTGAIAEGKLNRLAYEIHVNAAGKDLVDGSEVVTLKDVLDPATILILDSLRVVSMDDGTEVEHTLGYEIVDGKEELMVTIPDETPVIITYEVQVTGQPGTWANVTNTASLDGVAGGSAEANNGMTVQSSSAGSSGRLGSITLRKVDRASFKLLSGATFSLYFVDLSKEPIDFENGVLVEDLTTGSDGTVTFPSAGAGAGITDGALQLDQLYYYVEKTAPSGYEKEDEKHYFVIKSKDFDSAVEKIGSHVTYTAYAGANTVTVPNDAAEEETASLTVTKTFSGLSEAQIDALEDFQITVKDETGEVKATLTAEDAKKTGTQYQWTVDGLTPGTYTVTESGYTVDGYEVEVKSKETVLSGGSTTAAVTADGAEAELTNTYEKTQSAVAHLQITKALRGDGAPATVPSIFTFTVAAVTKDAPMPGTAAVTNTEAAVTFGDMTYDSTGDYIYQISETAVADGHPEYSVSSAKIYAKVSVAKAAGENKFTAAVTYYEDEACSRPLASPVITNTYTKPGSATASLAVQKAVTGDAVSPIPALFRFKLENAGTTAIPMPAATETVNDGANVTFGPISYEESGEYVYKITESGFADSGTHTDWSLSEEIIYAKVSVAAETGGLSASVAYYSDAACTEPIADTPTITNTHTELREEAKGSLVLTASKSMADPAADADLTQFRFLLKQVCRKDSAGTEDKTAKVLQTKNSGADGTIAFDAIAYDSGDAGCTYVYTVGEVVGSDGGIVYDDTVYTVTAEVAKEADAAGTLAVKTTIVSSKAPMVPAAAMRFVNDFTRVSIQKVDESGKPLAGAVLAIKDKNGKLLVDESGKPQYQWTTDGKAHEITGIPAGTYYLTELQAPEGYAVADDAAFTVESWQTDTLSVTMTDKKQAQFDGSIRVSKNMVYHTYLIGAHRKIFYVALFADAERTRRISNIQPIVFQESGWSTVIFEHLQPGTYYVGETDEYGELLERGLEKEVVFVPEYGEGYEVKLTKANPEKQLTFSNEFYDLPEGFFYEGAIQITKNTLLKTAGEAGDKTESYFTDNTYYAGVFYDPDYMDLYQLVPLEMQGADSATVRVEVPLGEDPSIVQTFYVTETDSHGTPLSDQTDLEFKVKVDGTEVILSESSAFSGETTITNTYIEEEEISSEVETETETETVKAQAPKTGDDTNYWMYLFLMTVSAGAAAFVWLRRKKVKNHTDR